MKPLAVRHPAFVLALYDAGVAVARGLVRHGIPVKGFDSDAAQPGFHSRVCRAIQCPRADDDAALVACLVAEARGHAAAPVLYPASDAFAAFIARNAGVLDRHFLFNLPDPDVVRRIVAKDSQYTLAETAGARVPAMRAVNDAAHFERAMAELRFPLFVKPVLGYRWQPHFANKGIRVDDAAACRRAWTKARSLGLDVIVQEIIPGPPTLNYEVSAYIAREGRYFGPFIMQKLRQFPAELGTGTAGESVAREDLARHAQTLMLRMGLSGMVNTEFKWDEREWKWAYIETNPRVWQQVELCRRCGLDLPLIQYRDLTRQELPGAAGYAVGVRWIDPVPDTFAFLESLRARELTLKRWLQSFRHCRVWGIFSLWDPWPAIRAQVMTRTFLSLCLTAIRTSGILLGLKSGKSRA
jgi:predicted ATP-grasp superfamily ATP-dependent carboligase